MFNRSGYISDSQWNRFLEFSKDLETPNVVINLSQIKFNFLKLKGAFPFAQIYYVVKANPGEPTLLAFNRRVHKHLRERRVQRISADKNVFHGVKLN